MIDPALLSKLEDAYLLTRNGFIRYLVEASEPEVTTDFDRRVLSVLADWDREAAQNETAIDDLLRREDYIPSEGGFPLEFSQYNFLSPTYLIHPAIEKGSAELKALSGLAEELSAWPEARDLVESVVARQRYHLGRLEKLEASRPVEAPRPPRIKGTSASRW